MHKSIITFKFKKIITLILIFTAAVTMSGCTTRLKPRDVISINTQSEAQAYVLWVGDTIAIKFFYNKELNDEVTIRPDGKISLQLIGEVKAAGLTPAQLESLLTRKYTKVLYAGSIKTENISLDSNSPAVSNVPYILSVGNTVAVKFFYNKDLNDEVTIRPDGKISLQLIGEVNAAGLTPAQLESLLINKYAKVLYAEDIRDSETVKIPNINLSSTQLSPLYTLPQSEQAKTPYILSVGNKIATKFSYNDELNDEVTIRPDGMISLKRIGEVKAAGLTLEQLTTTLTEKYSKVLYVGDVALNTPTKTELDPLDFLPETTYILGVGSTIAIKFLYNDELNDEVTIRPDGKISLRLIREVKAAGLTPEQLETLLMQKYSEFIESPKISVIIRSSKLPELTVEVKDLRSPQLTVIVKDFKLPEVTVVVKNSVARKVYVGGEVARPGMVTILGMLRLNDAVIQTGGALGTAELEYVVLIRYNGTPQPDVYLINLNKIMRGEAPDLILKPYDVVYVPRTAIAEVGLFTKQYLHNLIPVQFNVIYNLNPQVELKQ